MSTLTAWRITSARNLKLDLNTSSLDEVTRQLPEGYYSTFRTFDRCTRVLGLTAHLRRLYEPVSAPEVDESFLRRQLHVSLESYRPGEARVRTMMTKQGESYVAIEPLKPLPHEIYERGVSVVTTELRRQHPRLKSTAFISRSDSERKQIAREGIFEALLVKDGKVLEGMTSNFFYVGQASPWRPGDIANLPYIGTAGDHILFGITRQTVIDVALQKGIDMKYRALHRDQLADADEAFITSSSRGIVPVIQIDRITIGRGEPGQITRQLIAAYEAYVIENAEKIL